VPELTEQTTPNIELLEKVLSYIEDHPQEWHQETWACNTAACFAGHTLLLNGFARVYQSPAESAWTGLLECGPVAGDPYGWVNSAGEILHMGKLASPKGDLKHVKETALCMLGLTYRQANRLFHSKNSLCDLQEAVRRLKADPTDDLSGIGNWAGDFDD
jgi:hypothetical protein